MNSTTGRAGGAVVRPGVPRRVALRRVGSRQVGPRQVGSRQVGPRRAGGRRFTALLAAGATALALAPVGAAAMPADGSAGDAPAPGAPAAAPDTDAGSGASPGAGSFSLAAADVAERVLVRWDDGVGPDARRQALAAAAADDVLVDATAERVSDVVDVVRAAGSADQAAATLAALDDVLFAEPDRIVTIPSSQATTPIEGAVRTAEDDGQAPTDDDEAADDANDGDVNDNEENGPAAHDPEPSARPNDPLFDQQWALENTGQQIARNPNNPISGTAGVDVRALDAWGWTRGSEDVLVAVIDTAVDDTHPDLAGAVVREDHTIDDEDGDRSHGTSVASVIAARADDGYGMAGIAPKTSIHAIAAFRATANGPAASSMASVLAAFDLAAESGADVINASWVTPEDSSFLRDAVTSAGVPVVAASGNEGRTLTAGRAVYPAGWEASNLVAVTAVDFDGNVSTFSNIGEEVVDVAAPGASIVAAFPDGQHVYADGTSYAAPLVSGGLALAAAAAPYATASELIDAVSWTSAFNPSLREVTATAGMVDVASLVRGVRRPVCPPGAHPDAAFDDVATGNLHRAAIDCVTFLEVASGRGADRYDPGGVVTRDQMATFLFGVIQRAGADPGEVPAAFDDVSATSVHAPAIDALAHLGVVRGDGDGNFRPKAPVSRGHVASFVVATHQLLTGEQQPPSRRWFGDIAATTHVNSIDSARDLGLVRGTGSRTYSPAADTRRDQMASLLARTLDALARDGVEVS